MTSQPVLTCAAAGPIDESLEAVSRRAIEFARDEKIVNRRMSDMKAGNGLECGGVEE